MFGNEVLSKSTFDGIVTELKRRSTQPSAIGPNRY